MYTVKYLISFLLVFTAFTSHAELQCTDLFSLEKQAPGSFNLQIDKNTADDLLDKASDNLKLLGQLNDSERIVSLIAKTGLEQIDQNQITVLKSTRKHMAIFRSVAQITSEQHESSEKFNDLVRDFGRLNDYVANSKDIEAKKMAKLVFKQLANLKLKKLKKEIEISSVKSIKKYFLKTKVNTLQMLSENHVSIEDFHQIRKNLKEFLTFFQIANQVFESDLYSSEYQYLYDLNEELGMINDQLTLKVIDGDASKEKTKLLFPENLEKKITFFLEHVYLI